jgi:hypothetical protein
VGAQGGKVGCGDDSDVEILREVMGDAVEK